MPESTCSSQECGAAAYSRGWCHKHYNDWYRSQCAPCTVDGCEKPGVSRGWCGTHYSRWKKHGDPLIVKHKHDGHIDKGCTVAGCDAKHYGRGLCRHHYSQQPDQIEKAQRTDRARRSTPENRVRDRARLERRRRENGVAPKLRLTDEMRIARRRASKHERAKAKLHRAAAGKRGTRQWIAGLCAFPPCRQPFVGSSNAVYCSTTCLLRLERRKRKDTYGSSSHRSRARHHGVKYEPVSRIAVFKRDGYRCQICKRKTRGRHWLASGKPNPLAPTLDHIVPMARGGDHVFHNLQCACLGCNCKKGAGAANDQLLLDTGAFV